MLLYFIWYLLPLPQSMQWEIQFSIPHRISFGERCKSTSKIQNCFVFCFSCWLLAISHSVVSAKPTNINPRSGYLYKANSQWPMANGYRLLLHCHSVNLYLCAHRQCCDLIAYACREGSAEELCIYSVHGCKVLDVGK